MTESFAETQLRLYKPYVGKHHEALKRYIDASGSEQEYRTYREALEVFMEDDKFPKSLHSKLIRSQLQLQFSKDAGHEYNAATEIMSPTEDHDLSVNNDALAAVESDDDDSYYDPDDDEHLLFANLDLSISPVVRALTGKKSPRCGVGIGAPVRFVGCVKSLKGIFIKLFVRGKGLNDIVRATLFCNSIDQFKYVGRQLNEQYGHNVYIKPPKQEAEAWPIPKLLIYGKRQFLGRCLSVEIQFSTVYMHLAKQASNNHLVYEAMRESTGYLDDKDTEFLEFLQSLNGQYIDTEGFLQNQSVQEGGFEILVEKADETESGKTELQESDMQYVTKATGFILSGRICCGDRKFQFMSSTDRYQRFSKSSFLVNRSLTLLSSHSYWSEESYDLEDKSVDFVVSFKGQGMVIAGIGTHRCMHGIRESEGGGSRCSVHVGRSKFVVRKNGVEEVFREKKLPNQERAKIIFSMKDGMLLVSFVGSEREDDEDIESVQVSMPSDQQKYYLYMRAPHGVHDVKFHDITIEKSSDVSNVLPATDMETGGEREAIEKLRLGTTVQNQSSTDEAVGDFTISYSNIRELPYSPRGNRSGK